MLESIMYFYSYIANFLSTQKADQSLRSIMSFVTFLYARAKTHGGKEYLIVATIKPVAPALLSLFSNRMETFILLHMGRLCLRGVSETMFRYPYVC